MAETIQVCSIGTIRSPHKSLEGMPIQGIFAESHIEAYVELEPRYSEGLKDLDGFSHAFLIYYFHQAHDEKLLARPFLENETHGIFAIRGPNRPNHIGLSIVRITKIENNRLHFRDVDILDGTPVLDMKPYVKQFDCREDASNGWLEKHFKNGQKPRGIVRG